MSTEHPDLPPERPLPNTVRADLRARLLAATGEEPGSGRRWLAPVAAAAAVLVVATVTGYAALRPGGDPDSGAPAGGGTASPIPAVPTPAGPESSGGPDDPSAVPSTGSPTNAPPPPVQVSPTPGGVPGGGESCAGVAGGEVLVSWPSAKGTTVVVSNGRTSQLCDDSGGKATLHAARPLDPAPAVPMTPQDLDFSTKVIHADQRQLVTAHVAGGQLPEGVTGISYLFPDGHEEAADVQEAAGRTWWRMEYTSYDGLLADPDVNRTRLDPVEVTVALSGTTETYALDWGQFACAQVNHGC